MAGSLGSPSGSGDRLVDALGGTELVAEFGQLSHASEDDDSVVRAEESTSGDEADQGQGGDTPPDSSGTDKAAVASKPNQANSKTSGEKEIITVTDETGRKRRVEIDYSNKEQIKRVYAQAAGMRKFQAERDKEISTRREVESKLQQREQDWQTLDQAFQQGKQALVDRLYGKGAFEQLVEEEMQKREFLRTASPEQKRALEDRERLEMNSKELEKIRKENNEFKLKVEEERNQAELRSVESQVNPVFEKYRFAARLGDAQDEHMFDTMLWNTSLERLKEYEEAGTPVTKELIEREFKTVASTIRKRISVQAEKRVTKVVEQKKQEATENVQARVKSGYSKSSEAQDLKKLLDSGDTGSIFKNWGKFSKVLGGR